MAKQAAALATVQMDPPQMLAHAVQTGAQVEVLEKLLALQERWQAGQARIAFDAAMAAAKADIRPIVKTNEVDFETSKGRTSYKFESLGDIADAVDPILAKNGLSYRYRSAQANGGTLSVTCIVSHEDGHSEETTLSAGHDVSGGKNPIQAVGSAVTYLQRYTLKLALGLATARDDDGVAAAPRTDTRHDEQAQPPAQAKQPPFGEYVMATYNRIKAINSAEALGDDYGPCVGAELDDCPKNLTTAQRAQLTAAVIEAWGVAWIALLKDEDEAGHFGDVIEGMPIKPARKEELRSKLAARRAAWEAEAAVGAGAG